MRPSPVRGLLLPLAAAVVLAFAPPAGSSIHGVGGRGFAEEIRTYRAETWHWQRVMGAPRVITRPRAQGTSFTRLVEIRNGWKRRAEQARQRAHRPPHRAAWLCIHRHEGAWTDPNAPYWGGLQMGLSFQQAYGSGLLRRKGTADHWTPLEQMWAAERAYRSGLGFSPWPNTSRYCGL